jgi:antitoxin component of MazEF toxin-antitoxin module
MSESKTYMVYTNHGALHMTLPAAEARQLDIKIGDKITFELRDQTLIMRKVRK